MRTVVLLAASSFGLTQLPAQGQGAGQPAQRLVTTDTLQSGVVSLGGVTVLAHQRLESFSSKGKRYTGGHDIEPGRQLAVFYPNPDSLRSHVVKGISVLIEHKFAYGRLRVNLRAAQPDGPAGPELLPASYFVLPADATRHHTWVTFTLPEGVPLPPTGVFIVLEGLTASDSEKFMGMTFQVKKAVTSDGSSRVVPWVKIQEADGAEKQVELADFPKLVTSPTEEAVASNTWEKISPNQRFTFKRNVPASLAGRKPTAYNIATQLTLLSW